MEKQNKKLRKLGAVLTLFAIAMCTATLLNVFNFEGNQKGNTFTFSLVAFIFGLMFYFFNKPKGIPADEARMIAQELKSRDREWCLKTEGRRLWIVTVRNEILPDISGDCKHSVIKLDAVKSFLKQGEIENPVEVKQIIACL